MKILKKIIISCAGLLIFYSCQDVTKDVVEPKKNEKKDMTNAELIKAGYLVNDNDIVNLLKSAQSPEGVREVNAGEPLDADDGIPIIVDDGDTPVDKSEFTTSEDGTTGYWVTSKTKYRMSQEFDETLIKDPSADILYPGCVIRGQSIADATYAFFNACNTGLSTYSLNATLRSGSGEELIGRAENIRMSDYRSKFSDWTHLDFNDDAVKTSYSMYHINSKEDAKFHAGVSVKHAIADAVANLDFNFRKYKNHFLVKFIQQKFNVTLDQPRGRATIFTSINPELMGNVQPVYVSNINYGRILFIAVSTNEEEERVNSAVEFMLKKVKGLDINTQLEQDYNKLVASSQIDLTVVGGNQKQQNSLLEKTLDGVTTFITTNPEINEVSPISFQMRYASTGAIARIVSQTEYYVPNRVFVPDFDKVIITVKPVSIRATGGYQGENDIYGSARAHSTSEDGHPFHAPFFDIKKNSTMRVNNRNIFTDLSATRIQFNFTKPKGKDHQEFLLENKITFNLNLVERGYTKSDITYAPATDTFTLSDLINIYNTDNMANGPSFILTTQNGGYTAGVKFQITDVEYIGNGKSINGKIKK